MPNYNGQTLMGIVPPVFPAAVVNVTDSAYGADWTGVADSTQAFQLAINACTGTANPATASRTGKMTLYVPPGVYRITADLNIVSTDSFAFSGAGTDVVSIVLSGTGFTNAGIFVDGSYRGKFSGFTLKGDGTEGAGAGALPYAFAITKTAESFQNTSNNQATDISVQEFNWATGMLMGDISGTLQNDDTGISKCIVSGLGNAGFGFSTKWLVGIQFGDGTSGNQYNHTITDTSVAQCQNGVKALDSSFTWRGGEFAANAIDFNLAPTGPVSIYDIQSQVSGRF